MALCFVSCRKSVPENYTPTVVGLPAPEFPADARWLNAEYPLTMKSLRGRVVLMYFWKSSSVNSVRAVPYMNRWHARYQAEGLAVVGVHAPQFSFEKEADNVMHEMSRMSMLHPVVLDNDFLLWDACKNTAWPTFYVIDANGTVRDVIVGEGKYDELEARIVSLFPHDVEDMPTRFYNKKPEVNFSKLGTPEIHAGYEELSHFGSPEPVLPNRVQSYSSEHIPEFNHFYLDGDWEVQTERSLLRGDEGQAMIRFEASRIYVVLGTLHTGRLRAEVRLDGVPLTAENYGGDIWFRDGKSFVEIDRPRIYELVNTRGTYGEHVLEIIFADSDIGIYSFMFG